MSASGWFVYVARCADGTLYVGTAIDVAARIAAHDAGKGAKYTRGRGPLVLLAKRRCASKGDALRLELALKKLDRKEKLVVASSARRLASFARARVTDTRAAAGTPSARSSRTTRRRAARPSSGSRSR